MKRILAVSGGVDSMVMLDIFAKNYPREELVVASFDHGTRESSARDAEFVSEISSALNISFYRGRLGPEGSFLWAPEGEILRLGEGAGGFLSEEEARKERYKFLFKVALRERGEVYTAQHLDDLIESIAINLVRGTEGRGVAVMGRPGVKRLFLEEGEPWGKAEILRYAAEHGIVYREDPSNSSERYLRNRLRGKVREMGREEKMEIYRVWERQRTIYSELDQIVDDLIPEDLRFTREMFREMPREVGREILRVGLRRAGVKTTWGQVDDFLDAILSYAPGKQFNLPGGRLVRIGRESFQLRVER